MRKVAGNETLEIWKVLPGENPGVMQHERMMMDARCRMVVQLLSAWGMAAAMGDMLGEHVLEGDKKTTKAIAPSALVMRICEVVDAAWNEMQHRGWIVDTGRIDQ